MIRRYGEPAIAGQKYQIRPGAYVMLPRGGDILCTFQAGQFNEFQLPGGGIDPGEHPIPALHREVQEETGWRIAEPVRVGAYRRFCYMPEYDKWAEKLCHIYIARPVLRLGDPVEPDHSAVWLPIAEAAQLIASPGDRAFVETLI
ncbi:NUDIX domain-containing protein [Loktanella sp. IMCC34160]|uniref:NUDIX hydrolase n=1 Tax=Loktanella sp. IMCC34160 TaxID=2510646 RepID=UPI00101DB9A7|nr:NUDIX hydrolase [Loktanella sp. IMCC34160]RYG91345.1 NUDIX domain-containing protein [Loktanella sp. IMCC34160]